MDCYIYICAMGIKPRKLKKAIKKVAIAYDVESAPDSWDLPKVVMVLHKTGVVFYNSVNGNRPQLLTRNNKRIKIVKTTE